MTMLEPYEVFHAATKLQPPKLLLAFNLWLSVRDITLPVGCALFGMHHVQHTTTLLLIYFKRGSI